jgi:hypothetical protein
MTDIAEARKIIECAYDGCESTISKITDYIYLTGLPGSLDYEKLKSLGIQHIVSLGCGSIHRSRQCPITVSYIDIDDMPNVNISIYFDYIYQRTKGRVTLFHCAMGISRSASMVIACLMNDNGFNLADAIIHVKMIRPWIQPNSGFFKQLQVYQMKNKNKR